MRYGNAPQVLGQFQVDCQEMLFVQYLPIVFPHEALKLPPNLECFASLVQAVLPLVGNDDYLYITAKMGYSSNNCSFNREGWHSDGFGTPDLNFIWSDSSPTEFCIQEFDLSQDCSVSMVEMQQQVRSENVITYSDCTLLQLDSSVIHRVNPVQQDGPRTFCKLSISKEKYNLKGNAHNYLFDYSWDMKNRSVQRNHPISKDPM